MRFLGHPVHAIVVAFPIALLAMAFVWDALAWLGLEPALAFVGYYSELAGLVLGALAIVTGLAELVRPELSSALRSKALRHAAVALGAVTLFALAFALRRKAGATALPSDVVFGLEAAGAVTLALAGFLGGDLIFRDGVGVRSEETVSTER